MTIFQNSLGRWVFYDGDTYQYFDTQQEAQMAMIATAVSEQPIEAELAARITGELLPQLRALFAAMTTMQLDWRDNEMSAIIEKAAQSQQTIAGFPAENWVLWGATFNALQAWLETENEALGGVTPRQVLMRRYVAVQP